MSRRPYLDVMTIRSTQPSSLEPLGLKICTANISLYCLILNFLESHSGLLVEPILLPDMHHVGVDPVSEAKESCVFYPTGEKNSTLGKKIGNDFREANMIAETMHSKVSNRPKSRRKTSLFTPTRPRLGLYASRPVSEDAKRVIMDLRKNESKLTGMVVLKI